MRTYEKDYRYLLLHVVPQHRLSPDTRRQVEQALHTGNSDDLRRQSVRVLEELVESDYLTRVGVRPDNGNVVIDYKKKGGRFQLSVSVPSSDWTDVTGGRAAGSEPVPKRAEHPSVEAPASSPASAPVSYQHVTDILRSVAVADRSEPILARLEGLLETVQQLVDLVDIRLFLIDEVVAGQETRGELVQVVSDAELRATTVLCNAIETGTQKLYARDEIDGADWKQGGGDWSVLGVSPIFSMGKVHGGLCALFAPGIERSSMESRLEMAADTVRRVVEYHNQIENLTSVDALTGIYNRHFFDTQLAVEIERAMRSGSVVSMLVLDIDDFKRVNDELGHKKGDEALSAVADIIRRNLRKVDLPFRYGGEEIVILLPGTSEFESVHTAERLRRVISQYEGLKDMHGQTRQLTVSVGVAVYPDTARTADNLFTQADRAMYQAKQQGKNRVVLHREETETDTS